MILLLGALLAAVGRGSEPGVCEEPASIEEFHAAALAGEQAFSQVDLPALTRAREFALELIPCLDEPVPPEVAAEFHRMMAMAAFTRGDEALVLAEFHAARRLDTAYRIPPDVAPEGHPLVRLYAAAARDVAPDRALETIVPPVDGSVVVDGTRDALRPSGLSAIVQVYGSDDVLTHTQYLLPWDPTPRFGPLPIDLERQRKQRRALAIATGSTALVAGGLHYGAVRTKAYMLDESRSTYSEVPQLQTVANALEIAAVSVGTVSVGLGVRLAFTF